MDILSHAQQNVKILEIKFYGQFSFNETGVSLSMSIKIYENVLENILRSCNL